MTRTEHATLSHEGRDVELLAQQERAEQFNASTILDAGDCDEVQTIMPLDRHGRCARCHLPSSCHDY